MTDAFCFNYKLSFSQITFENLIFSTFDVIRKDVD